MSSFIYPEYTLSGYLLIKKINILNANAVSSPLTYGFPAVSGFVGSVHALSRKIRQIPLFENVGLDGVLIASHQCQVQSYRESAYKEQTFIQTRNPILKSGKPAAIVEEGRCHLTVSLMIGVYCQKATGLTDDEKEILIQKVTQLIQQQRIAGGSVFGLDKEQAVEWFASNRLDDAKRKLLPAFVLMNADKEFQEITAQLQKERADATALDALLETAMLHHEPTQQDHAWTWKTRSIKQGYGWLVPMPVGFQGISRQFEPDEMANCRHVDYASQYVESIYGLGKWLFPYRIDRLEQAFWYQKYIPDEGLGLYLWVQAA